MRNRTRHVIVVFGLATLAWSGAGCHKAAPTAPSHTLPANIDAILTKTHSDPLGDQALAPAAAPPVVVPYPPADVVSIGLGVSGSVLYMRVTFAGVIPRAPVEIPAQGIMPPQTVKNQGMSLNMDVDNDKKTGAAGEPVMSGIDIFFGLQFIYGERAQAYANYDFPGFDVHANRGHIEGTFVEGGAGSDHATIAFEVSSLGAFFPRGRSVAIGAWSEAESYRTDGSLLYHHFAFDPTTADHWTIPD